MSYEYYQDETIQPLIFLDNIIVQFGARVFQQTIGIPTGTNCVSLLADLFLHTSGILYKKFSFYF
jgi:hypothetical protein